MAIENDFETVAGQKLFVCKTLPATKSAADYAALAWVEVGSITNVGSVKGRSYNTSTLATVGNAMNRSKKASYSLPDASFECAWVEDDAGQIIIEAGANSYDTYAFKLEKEQSGALRYFTAQVKEFIENNGTSDNNVLGNFVLLRQSDTVTA
ncbi:hypothetical protein GTP38_23325 [Duganella sp. FT94W]|uniref:DUF3277 family protein n=1 Tax=Duganella lactea TaxID=2692173 RepID=A0ABW9VI45_9BURK|nr:hypothetical protein [Duganella lactea]MYM37262.1 hypothetical protein [Duganella lactea]